MKKSELRQIIKEELLSEVESSKLNWYWEDIFSGLIEKGVDQKLLYSLNKKYGSFVEQSFKKNIPSDKVVSALAKKLGVKENNLREATNKIAKSFKVNGQQYFVSKVEDDRYVHVYDTKKNTKTFDLKWLVKNGVDIFEKPKEKIKKVGWNDRMYQKWIKDSASGGGANHAHDMAQNAKYEPGLIQYVAKQIRKMGGDERPLERIQWDIENYA